MPNWKPYEGELADGKFPLERYLGGSEASGVFLTRLGSGRAAIKLVPASQARAAELVERWNRAATLSHPHLARILAAGTCMLAGMPLAYLVMEYAEENLADVLRERPLTSDETRDMLQPVADALAYLHGQGLAHGNLKPSNIVVIEDTVKISTDAVSAGDAARDLRALGVTLVQALTRQPANVAPDAGDPAVDALPVPFRELAQNCLHPDPRLRWSAARIGTWLSSRERPASTTPPAMTPAAKPAAGKPRPWHYVAAATLAIVAVAIVGRVMQRTDAPVPSVVEPVRPAPAIVPPKPSPVGQPAVGQPAAPKRTPSAALNRSPKAAPQAAPPAQRDRVEEPPPRLPPAPEGITHRVLPDISAKARSTVHGKAMEVVRVAVDRSGSVTEATLERTVSPYFGKLALEAARHWQFSPEEGGRPRSWILRFEIMRTGTQVTARRADRE